VIAQRLQACHEHEVDVIGAAAALTGELFAGEILGEASHHQ
jgi:hypothetical protein